MLVIGRFCATSLYPVLTSLEEVAAVASFVARVASVFQGCLFVMGKRIASMEKMRQRMLAASRRPHLLVRH